MSSRSPARKGGEAGRLDAIGRSGWVAYKHGRQIGGLLEQPPLHRDRDRHREKL